MLKTLFIPSMKTLLLNFNKKRIIFNSVDYQAYEDVITDSMKIISSETIINIWLHAYSILDEKDQRYLNIDIENSSDILCYNT